MSTGLDRERICPGEPVNSWTSCSEYPVMYRVLIPGTIDRRRRRGTQVPRVQALRKPVQRGYPPRMIRRERQPPLPKGHSLSLIAH